MISPKYGVKCLRLGFQRYKRYCKLPVSIELSQSSVSFYLKKPSIERGKNARVSNHHLSMQRFADKNEAWLSDNISIVFIVPNSQADTNIRARVYQNAQGTIQPFDVTTYQYNAFVIDPSDLVVIFKAIIRFLEGEGYYDPFDGTEKRADILPRHSNIKPFRGKNNNAINNNVSSSNNSECKNESRLLNDKWLNEMAHYCMKGYLLLNEEYNQNNCNKNMNRNSKNVVRLTESKLRNMIDETVRSVLNEISYKTYSDAASAAADRESIFKDHPGYPETPMRRSYDDGNKLDKRKYERDAERQMRQSRQPEKFKKAAYTALSREICGEDDFGEYVRSYINNNQVDDRLIQQIKQYKEGEKHIMGNNTKWSARNGY